MGVPPCYARRNGCMLGHIPGAGAHGRSMQRPLRNPLLLISLAWLCLARPIAWAETGFLVLHVQDVHVKDGQRRPIIGLQIQAMGDEGEARSAITDQNGKARIRLATQTTENSWVSLQIGSLLPART